MTFPGAGRIPRPRQGWAVEGLRLVSSAKGAAHLLSMPAAPHNIPFPAALTAITDGRKLYQRVANTIVACVQAGTYKIGDRLPSERDLAVEFEVGRTTVREAMLALEIRGVAQCRHGSGVYIIEQSSMNRPPVDLNIGALELTEARLLFEGEAAALAATTITVREFKEIAPIIDEMQEENWHSDQHNLADRRFHVAIARATRNKAISLAVEVLLDIQQRSQLCVYMMARARSAGAPRRVGEHRLILAALRKRDPAAARFAMRAHLARTIEDLIGATEIEAIAAARTRADSLRVEYTRRLVI